MIRSRLSLFVILTMLLASTLSTETVEVWLRVAVGAAALDDDDGPYFTFQAPNAGAAQQNSPRPLVLTRLQNGVSATAGADSAVDEPAFRLPQSASALIPVVFVALTARPLSSMERAVETRGPPARTARFVRPPPRAPPLS